MTTPRRRVLRPVAAPAVDPVADRRRAKLQDVLAKERLALKRWMTRLRRSFKTVDCHSSQNHKVGEAACYYKVLVVTQQ